MVSFTCDSQELQHVKDALIQDPHNGGIGVLHVPAGRIFLAPFDMVPGGHAELATKNQLPLAECRGFVIWINPDRTFSPVNNSHLNGTQGQPGSLQMPTSTFQAILKALEEGDL